MHATLRLAALAALSLCTARLPAQTSEVPMLKPEEFVILPWSWAKGSVEYMKEIRACGMNLAGLVDVKDLDAVRAAGLKCLVFDPSIHAGDAECALSAEEIGKRVDAVAARIRGRSEVFGVYLRDEPSSAVYPGLAKWSAAVKKALPGLIPYINLFPNYASPAQMGVPTYDEYLAKFIEATKAPFLSYDHYALMDDGTLRDGYFQNLEAARKASLAAGIPFWNIVLANSHFHYAEPSLGGLQFQAYTTLAYGARGLSYFTYTAPEVGNYRLAPIDQFGNKTATWDLLRNVNNQIHRVGPTYVKLKSVNVFHHPNVPKGCAGIATSKHVAELTGGDFVVGEFEDAQGAPTILVVNKDLHRSTAFSVKFKQAGGITQVNCFTGSHNAWGGENNWLAPGQGMLLYVKKP
jgi:hypothetical protein